MLKIIRKIRNYLVFRNNNVVISGRVKVCLGEDTQLGFSSRKMLNQKIFISAKPKGGTVPTLHIGDRTRISQDVEFHMNDCDICIGSDVVIGAGCRILSSDFHAADRSADSNYKEELVSIGDNCFIGINVIILKGSIIPKEQTIPAGSIITRKTKWV